MSDCLQRYQVSAMETAKYPREAAMEYLALGLCSEAGEVAGKIKKIIRDGDPSRDRQEIFAEQKEAILSEVGDCLWYVAMLALELNCTLEKLATDNLAKLSDRKFRGKISGDGDNR